MKSKYVIVLLVFLCGCVSGFGQIYTEDFTGQNGKGAVGPNPPTIDVSGVTWSMDISSSNLTATDDWFRVQNERFEAQDVDGNSFWFSPSINIASYTNVNFQIDVSESGTLEAGDLIQTTYRINGGSWIQAATNGFVNNDFAPTVVSQTGLNGNTLELRVRMNNNGGGEFLRIDNIVVDGTPSGPSISATPTDITDLDYGFGSGPSAAQSFDVTGNLLVNGTTIASNSTNFQVSLSSGSGYANAVNVPAGTLNSTTTIYTRLVAGLAVNTYSSTLTISNTTPSIVTIPTINVSGEVTPPPPTNDDCTSATNLVVAAAAISGTLSSALPTAGLGQQPTKNDVWYSFTPSCSSEHEISVTFASGPDLDLYVYDTNCPSSGNALYSSTSGNSTDETLTNSFTAGTTYYVRVLDFNNDASNFNISVDTSGSGPNNGRNIESCLSDTSIELSWDPSTGTPPTGYIIFARQGTTSPASGSPANASTYLVNSNYAAATDYGSLGRAVYKGTGTSATVTGLTNGLDYTFKVVSYFCETSTLWSSSINSSGSWDDTFTIDTPPANITSASVAPTSSVISWTNPLPLSCYEVMIVANEGSASALVPSGNSYTANSIYSGPDSIVFKGTGTTTTVTGLTTGITYCYTIFVRNINTNDWSSGDTLCQTTGLSYCSAGGTTSFDTGITGVTFNTINNTGTSANSSYTDYTAISTDVTIGNSYNLGVVINIDGPVDVYTRVWIDWNQNGSFNDSGEQYELGMDTNPNSSPDLNTATSNSPISVEVPTNAAIGATRMRVFAQYNSLPTSCSTGIGGEAEDYTINVLQPTNAEINIKGNNISIPGDLSNAPAGLDNTLYGGTDIGMTTAPKIFEIENLGLANLTLTGSPRVQLTGTNAGDFQVSLQPLAPNVITTGDTRTFQITFTPTADGERNAIVTISNNDSNENPYQFNIRGTGQCTSSITSSIWPIEGPENTEVTITSATDLTGATASINGLAMTIISSTATELVVLIPAGATSGNLNVLFTNGCSSTNVFTIIDDLISGCETSTGAVIPPDLFISEISDATSGSSSFIEIFNGTVASVNLANYTIRIYNNDDTTPTTNAVLSGTLAPGSVHVISVGTTSCDLTGNGLMATLPNETFNSAGGINFDLDSSDAIVLYNSVTATEIDVFGVPGSDNWANGLVAGGDGVNFRRLNTATALPSPTFILADWTQIEWSSCGDSDYSGFGDYDFSLGIPPSVTALSSPMTNCTDAVQLSIVGTEGVSGGVGLLYQWYYLVPGNPSFETVPNTADFNNNVTSAALDIINPIPYADYQFYCQVRENGVTCYTASNVVKLNVPRTVWDTGAWTNGVPTLSTIAIINDDYNTSIDNIQACQLIINAGNTLTVSNSTFVEVQNDVTVNGTINVTPRGNFVQRGIDTGAGSFSSSGTTTVSKITSNFFDDGVNYHYTYWSSPVVGANIISMFPNPAGNRRYFFNSSNYLDQSPIDDIDDNGDDWQVASSSMDVGTGYAVTATTPPSFPYNNSALFSGDFNTGDIPKAIIVNGFGGDNDWNFIGNPYPSAIDFNDLHSVNSTIIDGAAFLWSQSAPPDIANPGNEVINFNTSDYAIISAGSGNTAGGAIGLPPNDFIPSGQGFFVRGLIDGTLMFNNSMRMADATSNNIFFEANDQNATIGGNQTEDSMPNRLWLDLTSDNGIFNQILIAYVDGATNDVDSWSYDVPRNMSTGTYASFYSLVDENATKFAIQGKSPESLNLDEVIQLGFNTSIDVATLYTISIPKMEGDFLIESDIYIKDNLLNTLHNLKESGYNFTSSTGTFNDRFEIVFTEDALSTSENVLNANALKIIERPDGKVWFKVAGSIVMDTIEIIDLQGRTIYNFKVTNNESVVYDLSALSNATYIAKVTLDDGRVIIKKDVKRY